MDGKSESDIRPVATVTTTTARNLCIAAAGFTLLSGVALIVALLIADSLVMEGLGLPLTMLFFCSFFFGALPGLIFAWLLYKAQRSSAAR